MKPATNVREIVSSGELVKGTFGISYSDEAHIMGILRDGLYTDKVMAVLREYASNAWDAHRDAGKPDLPIKVHIPTPVNPKVVIRDFGPGLSEDDIFEVYTKYGRSTKRMTDNAVGMLGIGCKAGFAYSESFTVTSWNGGMKKVYIAVLDDSDRGEMNKLHEEPCGDETGIEIQIPVRPKDIWMFTEKAKTLFAFFDPQPDINIELPTHEGSRQKSGFVSEEAHQWVALMGCVAYKVDPYQLREELDEHGIWNPMTKLNGALYFDIGEVRISANREELKYTEKTRELIAARAKSLFDEYITAAIKTLKDSKKSAWDRRVQATFMVKNLGLRVPTDYVEWTREDVSLWGRHHKLKTDAPSKFTLHRAKESVTTLPIKESHFLILRDDHRSPKNFDAPTWNTTFVRPAAGATLDEVRAELDEYLTASNLDGIKVKNLTDYTYSAPVSLRNTNKKHRVRTFRLQSVSDRWSMCSDNWAIEDREPTDDDVFIIIYRFQAKGYANFESHYLADSRLAKWLGVPMPEVYGYKTSVNKPVTKADCQGTHYSEWRKTFFATAITRFWREMAGRIEWKDALDQQGFSLYPQRWRGERGGREIHKMLVDELGEKHSLTRMFSLWITGHDKTARLNAEAHFCLRHWRKLVVRPNGRRPAPQKALDDFLTQYPLFNTSDGLEVLKKKDALAWLGYVKLIDRDRENSK